MSETPFRLVLFVDWLCRTYNGSVTSWWRSAERNKSVGGVPTSLHVKGRAVDVVYDHVAPDLAVLMKEARAYGVRVLREKDHDHIEVRDAT